MIGAPWTIGWDRVEATVLRSGAMLGPARFELDDGRIVQPFAIAPWAGDTSPEHAALPELLKRLRGEWACVPYGMPDPPSNLPEEWRPLPAARGDDAAFHGYSSNGRWRRSPSGPDTLDLVLDYPASHPVRRVTRRIRGARGRGELQLELSIETRIDTMLPIGLHPTFRLPPTAGSATVAFDGDVQVHTYPIDAEAGVSRIATGLSGVSLQRAPCKDGSFVDLSRHPLPFATEELVLVTGHGGGATLTNVSEGYAVRLRWDVEAFPSCMLWISNKGRSAYPWNSRFQAIAIEPVIAPFDLGTAVARRADNPLRRAGVPTTRSFTAGVPWTTGYSIEVVALDA